jgi:hypothetical protein
VSAYCLPCSIPNAHAWCCGAAGPQARRRAPYLKLSGVTKPPYRSCYSARSEHGKAKSCRVAVFAQLGCANYQAWCSCSTMFAKACSHQSKGAKGRPVMATAGLRAEEMADILISYLKHVRQERQLAGPQRQVPKVLVVDRDPSHTSSVLKPICDAEGITLLHLPPRAHDLQPLDSHFFGQVKAKHDTWCTNNCGASTQQVSDYLHELLRTMSPDASIEDYELKLDACIASRGGQFEEVFKQLKAKRNKQRRAAPGAG